MLNRRVGAPRRSAWISRRWSPLLALVFSALAACSPGGAPKATVRIEPATVTIAAGAVEQEVNATVTGGGAVSWTLAGVGSLSASAGPSVLYTPPVSVVSAQVATLTATSSGVSADATITVEPVSATAGNLSIYLDQLVEAGSRGAVEVTGPGGFSATLTASRTLLDLAPGDYTISASSVRVRQGSLDAIRRPELACPPPSMPGGVTCSVTVTAAQTARVHAVYHLDPASGRVYLPSYAPGSVGGYGASQLTTSNSEPPAFLLGGTPSAQGVAFDARGNLWVSDWDNYTVREYAASDLGASGSPTPLVTLTVGGLNNPTALAFDASGNLWVTNRGNATVTRFDAAQLIANGSPLAAAVLSDDGSNQLSGPSGIAFDANGRLWFANTFSRKLFRYDDPGALVGGTTAAPDAVIDTFGFTAPVGLAFSESGDLWVSDDTTIVKLAPDQLEVSGTVTPTVILAGLGGPSGMAFDAAGNLWVTDPNSRLLAFAPAELAVSGSPTPSVVVSGFEGVNMGLLAFYPPPAGVPLAQPLLGPLR